MPSKFFESNQEMKIFSVVAASKRRSQQKIHAANLRKKLTKSRLRKYRPLKKGHPADFIFLAPRNLLW